MLNLNPIGDARTDAPASARSPRTHPLIETFPMAKTYRFDTLAIHAGQPNDPLTGAVTTPIYQTTTFAQDEVGGTPPWCYTRTGNPSRSALEEALAALEGATHGYAFASGLAACNAVLQCLSAGDHVVASQHLYGGCYRLFTKVFARLGVRFSLVDASEAENIAAAIEPTTRLVWLETPANPLLTITDIRACVAATRRCAGGDQRPAVLVDNTFATPVFQRPLELGADLVLHSTTKYIGGHCDVLGGAVLTSDPAWAAKLKFIQNATGAVPAPQDCFLLQRGLKTLSLRVKQHAENARVLAESLIASPHVTRVCFPGLRSHPGHDVHAGQSLGAGSILSIELEGGLDRVKAIASRLRLWTLAESLGGVKSLWCHPATMTHASVDAAERARVGIGDGLIRLSVGLEDPRDLLEDLLEAFEATRTQALVESKPALVGSEGKR
jgi:cystathionine gamma-lyase